MAVIKSPDSSRGTKVQAGDLRIMELVATGRTNIEIGRQLGVSAREVGCRIRAVQQQLSAPTKVAAVVQLVRRRLV